MSHAHEAPPGSSGAVPLRLGAPLPPDANQRLGLVPVARPDTAGPAMRVSWDNAGARRRATSMTFGITGRLVLTVLIIAFVLWLAETTLMVGAVLALPMVVWALRDVWAAAPRIIPTPPQAPEPLPRSSARSSFDNAAPEDQTGRPS